MRGLATHRRPGACRPRLPEERFGGHPTRRRGLCRYPRVCEKGKSTRASGTKDFPRMDPLGGCRESPPTGSSHDASVHDQRPLAGSGAPFLGAGGAIFSPTAADQDEQECEDFYVRTHQRSPDGRYTVRLPAATTTMSDLSESRIAVARLVRHMENRFTRDEELKGMYTQFMDEYERLQHMTPMAPLTTVRGCAISHTMES